MTEFKAVWDANLKKMFGIPKDADAQKVAEEVYSISEDPKAAQIVEKARDSDTELHKLFEWDDTIAAEKYRLRQAGDIMSVLKVTYIRDENCQVEPSKPVRLFFGNPDPKAKSGFSSILTIVKNEDRRQNLLDAAMDELRRFEAKYSFLSELQPVFTAIHNL